MLFVSFLRHSPSLFPEGNLVLYIRGGSPAACAGVISSYHCIVRYVSYLMYTDKPVHSRRVLRYRYVCYVVCTEKQVHIIYATSVFLSRASGAGVQSRPRCEYSNTWCIHTAVRTCNKSAYIRTGTQTTAVCSCTSAVRTIVRF